MITCRQIVKTRFSYIHIVVGRWQTVRNGIILCCIAGVFILLSAFFIKAHSNYKDAPARVDSLFTDTPWSIQQIKDLGEPVVTAFQPNEEFTVEKVLSSKDIVFVGLPIKTIAVQRRDGFVFQVGACSYNPGNILAQGTKVKIFIISWKCNPSWKVELPVVLSLGDAAHFYPPAKGAKP